MHDIDAPAGALPFGKFKGVPLDEVPTSYLEWTRADNIVKSPALRRAVEAELGRRGEGAPPPSRPAPSPKATTPGPPSAWPPDAREAAVTIVRVGAGVLAGRNAMTPALRGAHSLLLRGLAPEGEGLGGDAR